MKKHIIFLILIPILLVITIGLDAYAGGQNRAGTAAAPELTIPIGGRYIAMGGAPVAFATGVEAIYWNPAGLDLTDRSANAIFSYRSFIADISVNYLAVSGKFDFGTVGLSLRNFAIGDIAVTTEFAPDGTGEIFSPTFFVLGLSYSKQVADRISVGMNVNYINESFARVNASGVSFDFGVQYRDLVGIKGLSTGVVVKNIGPAMQYGGPGMWIEGEAMGSGRGITFYKVEAASFELPSVIEIGLAYNYNIDEVNNVIVTGAFQNNNFAYDELRLGAEYSYNKMFFVRGGYLLGAAATEDRPNIFQNFTAGAGIDLADIGDTRISFDYAYIPVKYFDANHVISIKVGF